MTSDENRKEVKVVSVSSINTKDDCALNQPYSRSLDNTYKRKKFLEKEFDGNKTVNDYYTNDVLHYSKDKALNKYKKKNYTSHTADVDHTVPLKTVYDRCEKNPFLNDNDIREIANKESNYKITSSRINRSKQSKSNIEYVIEHSDELSNETKKRLISEQIKAEASINLDIAKKTVKNSNKIGLESAKSAAKLESSISSIRNTIQVVKGEEDLEDAIENVVVDTSEAMAASYLTSINSHIIEYNAKYISKNSNEVISKVAEHLSIPGNAAKISAATIEAGQSIIKYANKDIDEDQLVLELGQTGTAIGLSIYTGSEGAFIGALVGECIGTFIGSQFMGVGAVVGKELGGAIGFAAGEVVGNMVGYIISSELFSKVSTLLKSPRLQYVDKHKINNLNDNLYKKMIQYEINLSSELNLLNKTYYNKIFETFKAMNQAILKGDCDALNNSLNNICVLFNQEIAFKSNDEFIDFLNSNEHLVLGIK